MIKNISTGKAPKAIGPYSQAVVADGFVFTSGQLPVDPVTSQIPDGIQAQTELVLQNLLTVLNAAGARTENVVKTTIFLKDISDFFAVNEIYSKYFLQPFPARSCIQAAALPKDVLIEIEAVALITKPQQ